MFEPVVTSVIVIRLQRARALLSEYFHTSNVPSALQLRTFVRRGIGNGAYVDHAQRSASFWMEFQSLSLNFAIDRSSYSIQTPFCHEISSDKHRDLNSASRSVIGVIQ